MTGTFSSTALAWLLTYAIHSTVLLSLAWLLVRVRRWSPGASELLWKSALLGGILTASVQLRLDVRPAGTVMLQRPTVTAPAAAPAPVDWPEAPTPTRDTHVTRVSESSPEQSSPLISMSRSSAVVLAWGIVALVLGLSYVARRLILVGRLGDRRAVPEGRLLDMLGGLARDAGLRRTPRLTCTSRISSPIALGVGEICVPETALTDLDLEQQRSLLAHELAHLARRDPLWLGLTSMVERVLWIQPLNRVANRQIATSAEFLCDDWAVRRTGSGVPLARCLAQVAEWIQASPLGVPVAGMAEERSLLVSRVSRLLEGVKPSTRSRRGLTVAAIAVLIAMIVVAPGVSGKSGSQLLNAASVMSDKSSPIVSADTGVVNALIARLGDEDADVRRAAAHSLGQLKDSRAVPGLIGALKDSDPKVRESAAEALAEFEDPRAIAPLAALLNDASTEVKQSALEALSHFDDGVPSSAVIRSLSDADAEVRHKAAHLAGKLRDRSATPALAKLVGDPDSDVRQAAIEAIGELKDPMAASAVALALGDTDSDVRQQAMNTMEELKAPIPEATLIGLMRDPDPDVRQQAAHLAGERSVIGAIPALRRMLEDPNGDVRESAVDALGNIADGAAYEALRAALTSKDAKVRRAAAEALGERR